MKKSIILLKQNSFIYNKNEYDFYHISEFENLFNHNMKIVILEEELYLKIFPFKKRINKACEFVQEKINDIFPQNGEILYDYEKNYRGDLLGIYSIKGSKRIERLCKKTKHLEVKPIQFVIRDIMVNKLNMKRITCSVLIKYEEYYYYICIKEGLFLLNYTNKDLSYILNKMSIDDQIGEIYIDKNISIDVCFKRDFQIIKENVMELINEKIC